MATYAENTTALDEIRQRIGQNQSRLTQAETIVTQAEGDLEALVTQYATIIADIDAKAIADPDNAAWQHAKAEKDLLAAEFVALKATATAKKNALAGA